MTTSKSSKQLIEEHKSRMAAAKHIAAMAAASGIYMEVSKLGLCILYYEAPASKVEEIQRKKRLEDTAFLVARSCIELREERDKGVLYSGAGYRVLKLHIDPHAVRFSGITDEFYLSDSVVFARCGYWIGEGGSGEMQLPKSVDAPAMKVRDEKKRKMLNQQRHSDAGVSVKSPDVFMDMTTLNSIRPSQIESPSCEQLSKMQAAVQDIRNALDSFSKSK